MPRFDGTGPLGRGPGTGWGMGPCGGGMRWNGYARPASRGFGLGFAGRRFFTKTEEKEMLNEEVSSLKEELKAIQERLMELK